MYKWVEYLLKIVKAKGRAKKGIMSLWRWDPGWILNQNIKLSINL